MGTEMLEVLKIWTILVTDHLLLAPDAVLQVLDPLLLVPVLLLTKLEQGIQGRRRGRGLGQDGPVNEGLRVNCHLVF